MTFDVLVKVLFEQSAPVALAVFAMWMLNRTWEARLEEAKRHADEIGEQRRELLLALNRNTEALTRLCERAEG